MIISRNARDYPSPLRKLVYSSWRMIGDINWERSNRLPTICRPDNACDRLIKSGQPATVSRLESSPKRRANQSDGSPGVSPSPREKPKTINHPTRRSSLNRPLHPSTRVPVIVLHRKSVRWNDPLSLHLYGGRNENDEAKSLARNISKEMCFNLWICYIAENKILTQDELFFFLYLLVYIYSSLSVDFAIFFFTCIIFQFLNHDQISLFPWSSIYLQQFY